jgi:hypothetical protein
MGPTPLQAVATFSNGDHTRGKPDLVLNPPLATCISPKHVCPLTHIRGSEAHSKHETSLVQAVCRSPHGLRLGQVELLQHKIPESIERMVHS